ncbi:uncharacterized protein L969DRAFT_97119 [Mixia osmundae IAM 14324]|uniref:Small-subunit processome Utp12 domain-containing protein n=1 Tax=Mixia osmundae (strain CBS 9802 / IAM 14324 / JCM 22182 / KY 12970) TaxID=764103 RepID=G7E1R1_MIXOS|nr:uncharacterized protein L969DRAFT_97119 [Mixia osmundae IAM 14324]KEI36721.1 hypothetical protein L969DRAFT_97119 [Mixia osmundae IAM 14324]GAA96771.1 hypothetical protein E5Q_03442 [Mixia osmundae IAM 14324]
MAKQRVKSRSQPKPQNIAAQSLSNADAGQSSTSTWTSFCPFAVEQDGAPATLFAQLSTVLNSQTVKVWDTTTSRIIARWSADSAAQRIACLAWVLLASSYSATSSSTQVDEQTINGTSANASKSKKRRKSSSASTSAAVSQEPIKRASLLALGFANGSIGLFDPGTASIVQTLSHPSSDRAFLALCSTESAKGVERALWTVSTDGKMRLWQLPLLAHHDGGLVSESSLPAALATAEHLQLAARVESSSAVMSFSLLVASHDVHIFDAELSAEQDTPVDGVSSPATLTLKAIGHCTGHAAPITAMNWASTATMARFLTAAEGDRSVCLWSLPAYQAHLTATLALDSDACFARLVETPAAVPTLIALDVQGTLSLALVSDEPPAAEASKTKKRKSTVSVLPIAAQITSDVPGDLIIGFQPSASGCVVLARGQAKPSFESIDYADTDGSIKSHIELAKSPRRTNGLLTAQDEDTEMSLPQRYSETNSSTVQSALPTSGPQPADPAQELDTDLTEATLEQRLKSLAVPSVEPDAEPSTRRKTKAELLGAKPGSHKRNGIPTETITGLRPAATLTQNLLQALNSADDRLLEDCLSFVEPRLIRETAKRLPTHAVLPLVNALVDRLAKGRKGRGAGASAAHPTRGKALVEWLRGLLVVHVGYLVTIPSLVHRLADLHAALSTRLSLHDRLLALNGRLELVVSQIDLRQDNLNAYLRKGAESSAADANNAGVRYVEGESSEEEGEDDGESSIDLGEDDDEDEEGSIEDIVMSARQASEDEDDTGLEGGANDYEEDEGDDEGDLLERLAELSEAEDEDASASESEGDEEMSVDGFDVDDGQASSEEDSE